MDRRRSPRPEGAAPRQLAADRDKERALLAPELPEPPGLRKDPRLTDQVLRLDLAAVVAFRRALVRVPKPFEVLCLGRQSTPPERLIARAELIGVGRRVLEHLRRLG